MISLEERKAIRRANVARLMVQYGQTRLAELIGIAPAYLHHLGKAQGKSKRNVNDDRARSIEQALGLPSGWMDVDHDASSEVAETRVTQAAQVAHRARWPFPRIPPEDFEALLPHQKADIEELVEDRIARFKARSGPRRRRKSRAA